MDDFIDERVEVLLIANDPDLADTYRLKLELDGYQVRIVKRDGRRIAPRPETLPDLIFLDLGSHDRDPCIMDDLRTRPDLRNVPIVILSSESPAGLRAEGFRLGPIDYVVSPPTTSSPGQPSMPWSTAVAALLAPAID